MAIYPDLTYCPTPSPMFRFTLLFFSYLSLISIILAIKTGALLFPHVIGAPPVRMIRKKDHPKTFYFSLIVLILVWLLFSILLIIP